MTIQREVTVSALRAILSAAAAVLAVTVSFGAQGAEGPMRDGDVIRFNASSEVQLSAIVDILCKYRKINVYYSPAMLREKVEIIAETTIPLADLQPFVERLLGANGYALVRESSGWYRVVKGDDAIRSPAKVTDQTLPQGEGTVTWVKTLKVLSAGKAAEIAKVFISKEFGHVTFVAENNTMLITDSATNLRRVASVLQLLDRAGAGLSVVRLPLANAGAEYARPTVEALLSAARAAAGYTTSSPAVFADKRANALVLLVRPQEVELAKECVKVVDCPAAVEVVQEVVSLQNLAPAQAVTILADLNKIDPQTATSSYAAVPLQDQRSLLVAGPAQRVREIKATLAKIDIPRQLPASSQRRIYPLSASEASETAETLKQLLTGAQPPSGVIASMVQPQALVMSLPKQNSLLVEGSPEIQQQVSELLKQLDRPQPQVLIQSLFFSTTAYDELVLTSEGGRKGGGYVAQTSHGLRVFEESGESKVLSLPFGLTGALVHRDQVMAIMNVLKTDRRSRVLSGPVLLAGNNEEAILKSVSETPYTAMSSLTPNTATRTMGGYATAGMEVTIKPVIGEADSVRLKVTISSSQFAGTQISPEIPPARQTNSVSTSINLRDRDAVIIGGLSDSRVSRESAGVPFLKDIPVLGMLFGKRGDSVTKNRFYVMIQPTIVRSVAIAEVLDMGLEGRKPPDESEQPRIKDGLWRAPGEKGADEWNRLGPEDSQ